MEEFKNREDYREAVLRLDGLHSSYNSEQRFLLLFKKYEISKNELILILRIFDGTFMWMQKIDRPSIDEMRKKSDVQGSYYSFCELMKQSIENNKYDLLQFGKEMSVIFYFQLTNSVQLRGTLEMFQGVPITGDEDTLKLSSDFLFDLYDSLKSNQIIYTTTRDEPKLQKKKNLDLIDIDRIPDRKPPPPKKNLYLLGQEVLQTDEDITLKAKTNQNIVMPTQKKRKTNGVRID